MKKVVLVVIVIAVAIWYFDISRRMTESSIRASYQAQIEALQRFDAKPLCDALDDSYQATVTARGSARAPSAKDKAGACADLTRTLRRMKTLSERTGGLLEPDYDYEIKSIELADDRKTATVEIASVMRIGDMTLARSRSVDHLIRRLGRIRSVSSEETVWAYRPE
ncbi:hypothetical protein [Rhodanobacter lindaniclasticus]|uniref:DUF4440 domain-containing protein n=1 Tax=Rhodanobacter lindaniclasticus TaxID=75310 RepID=A0A4S3KCN6_9GAMM|nr:hypothetical protein [Rhodanobacter lindaniclasticus]THD06213.1 hypothetical protein B1991_14155 [Rhodanobacter lindaniclasticus]